MRVSVIGCGYSGVLHAASMVEFGHVVVGIGVGIDPTGIERLSAGRVPFYEPGFEELLGRSLASGRLSFSTDMAHAAGARVHFLCAGTPQNPGELAVGLSHVDAAAEALVDVLRPRELVVGRSAVPVGTAARLAEMASGKVPGSLLAWNPEFLREGFAVQDMLRPDRLVYGLPDGVDGQVARELLDEVYAPVVASGTPQVVTDYATAEMVKTADDSFLATKISFINAMAELCGASGADVRQLTAAIGHDDRAGRQYADPGPGGGELPRDVRAFTGKRGPDQALAFLHQIRMVELARESCDGSLLGKRVAVLGAADGPDSDDIRDSPALHVASHLQLQGADVRVAGQTAVESCRRSWPQLVYAASAEEAAERADLVVVLTARQQYRGLEPVAFGEVVRQKRVLDGPGALDRRAWESAGWDYRTA